MNNTYRPPGGRPPVGINTPMAPTPPNRVSQMIANEKAKNAAINSRSYTGNAANAPTLPMTPPGAGGVTRMQAAQQAELDKSLAQARQRPPSTSDDMRFNLGGGPNNLPPSTGGDPRFNLGANPPPTPAAGAVFRKGGNVKAYAKGGKVSSASSRGDGIASKGKTRGKMC